MSDRALGGRRRVLFFYNEPGWAIYNVGRDWARLLSDTHDVTLQQFGRHEHLLPGDWDHVVWGYSTMGYSGRMLVESLTRRPWGWLRWQSAAAPNLAAVVQDPSEIFPEVPGWKQERAHTAHLRRFQRLAVTSNEMHELLTGLGFPVTKVNTRSLLPLRDRADITSEGLRVFTRAQIYPRKDLPRFEAIRQRFGGSVERFDPILGGAVMDEADYVRQIDGYNCYLCTSWQEGGPLTLMDAQRRGCVVLTTRVGQTDELVQHGVNGFFCADEEEFVERLTELRDQPLLLREMRMRALERAADGRDSQVRQQLRAFLP